MRTVLTVGGIPTFVSGTEHKFLEKLGEKTSKNDMDDRQKEMARVLATRGVLRRMSDENGIYYTRNQNKGLIQ